jgi:ABC-type multidrug transport system ATPase subunit
MASLVRITGLRTGVGSRVHFSIDNVSFESGKLHLLVGSNGAGKSTFLRILLGFEPITSGQIIWEFDDGQKYELGPDTRRRLPVAFYQRVGYLPQGGESLWPNLTVHEHVSVPLQLKNWKGCKGSSRNERDAHVKGILKRAQVSHTYWTERPGKTSDLGRSWILSGGERQAIAYARAISGDPEVLVLDELEASLDETVRRQFIDTLTRDYLATPPSEPHTAFIVTHDKDDWLSALGDTDNKVMWEFKRGNESIQLEPVRDNRKIGPDAPQEIYRDHLKLTHEIESLGLDNSPTSTEENWNKAGWVLSKSLRAFIGNAMHQPEMILTVVGPSISHGNLDSDHPRLLGAVGPLGKKPDGADAAVLRQFLSSGEPHVFPEPESFSPAPGSRVRLNKGLLLELFNSDPGQCFKGGRIDHVQMGSNGSGEYFYFPRKMVAERDDTQAQYLELSKETKGVYLFQVVNAAPGARLVVAIDLLEQHRLGGWQCYFVIEALHRMLGRLIGG